MKQPGPPRKPTALKVIEGNPGKRALPRDEPKPAPLPAPPPVPDHLGPEAREEWMRRAPELWRLGVLTSVDVSVFEAYCEAYGRWRQAEAIMKRISISDPVFEGLMVKTKNGTPIYNPVLVALNRALAQMSSLASEFGMTPAGRSRVVAKPPPAADDVLARLLG